MSNEQDSEKTIKELKPLKDSGRTSPKISRIWSLREKSQVPIVKSPEKLKGVKIRKLLPQSEPFPENVRQSIEGSWRPSEITTDSSSLDSEGLIVVSEPPNNDPPPNVPEKDVKFNIKVTEVKYENSFGKPKSFGKILISSPKESEAINYLKATKMANLANFESLKLRMKKSPSKNVTPKKVNKQNEQNAPGQLKNRVMKIHLWSNRVLTKLYTTPLNRVNANPFVSSWTFDKLNTFKTYTIGIFMCIVRLVPSIIVFFLNSLMAKLFVMMVWRLERWGFDSEPVRLLGQKITFFLMRVTFFFVGIYWIKIIDKRKNREKYSPIIAIAPHSSFYDLILIVALKRATFVSRVENLDTPFVGNILRLCRGIYVDRNDKNSRQTTMEEIKKLARQGECVLIFPEGTCTNRSSLLQFKLGAFIPKLPIQPVIVRWDAGNQRDTVSWTWEGPDHFTVIFNGLTKLSTNCEVTILEEWRPNDLEKDNPRLFAENLSKYMCSHLGVLQSRYSFDDVPLMSMARSMGLFRSPIIFGFLNVCSQYLEHRKRQGSVRVTNQADNSESSSRQNIIRDLKLRVTQLLQASMSIVEDAIHTIPLSDTYIPKQLSGLDRDALAKIDNDFKKQDAYFKDALLKNYHHGYSNRRRSPEQGEDEYIYLQTTKVWRRKIDPKDADFLSNIREHKRALSIAFVEFINYCLSTLERDFQYRVLKSIEDVLFILKLDEYFDDSEAFLFIQSNHHLLSLFQILEQTLSTPVTTAHLLMVLHLCDTREPDMWERMRIAYIILEAMRKAKQRLDDHDNATLKSELAKKLQLGSDLTLQLPGMEYSLRSPNKFLNNFIDLDQFRTLLWYSLGISDFNDLFMIETRFTFDYLRHNLVKLFNKAVLENAEQLIQ